MCIYNYDCTKCKGEISDCLEDLLLPDESFGLLPRCDEDTNYDEEE